MSDAGEKFRPYNDDGRVTETAASYVARMQSTLLPDWPSEVLEEWLFRHESSLTDYRYIGYERMIFTRENWTLEQVPGSEVFRDPTLLDCFSDLRRRAAINKYDWLAHYMIQNGTWNTPIILFKHTSESEFANLRSPLHLLEGHRRLSFLNTLRDEGQAKADHDVFVVRL